jgi:NSS family neurotransmitter:Na+ symporter
MASLAAANGASRRWGAVGGLGVIVSSLILSYYSVIGGWAIAYAVDVAVGGLPASGAKAIHAQFDSFLHAPSRMLGYHTLFMAIIAAIVARGIASGIEVAVKVLMPVMVVLMIVLGGYSLLEGDAAAALRFLFVPDFSHISPRTALEALGLGFFSIGVGYATLMTYAAYADRQINLGQAALTTLIADTAVSLISGLAVFPLVFAHHLDPGSGPGLVFVTLPLAFADMHFGREAAVAFFASLSIAAIASAISLLEMPVAFLSRRFGWSRPGATLLAATVCWAGGFATVYSFGRWEHWHPLATVGLFSDAAVFDLIDGLSTNVLLPVAGLGISLFAGWVLPWQVLMAELGFAPHTARLLSILLRYVVPAFIVLAALEPLLRAS